MSHILTNIASIALLFLSLLLMFVILLQRGRGGGLAGAFGGAGGQSAFGTKAGDVFTRITIGIAIAWVALAVLTGYAMSYESSAHKYQSPVANSSDGGTEGAVEAKGGGEPAKENPFEAGSQEEKTPSKDAAKSKDTSDKASPAPAGKIAPATKGSPANPADKSK
jgi:preprotein translocase subunit SecG